MADKKIMVALDCGNTSFRTVVGEYENGKVETTLIDQQPNGMIKIGDYYYWDIMRIFNEFKTSLKNVVKRFKKVDSIGICTWGVDFALFDKGGHMIMNPLCYRNEIGEAKVSALSAEDKEKLFFETGILCDKINSVYMMSGLKEHFPDVMSIADKCLMVPDILNYFLTGEMVNEPSEFSTTQLMDARTRQVSSEVCAKMGVDESLFSRIGEHGKLIGYVRKDILEEVGADYEIPVVCVPSHDTACAVTAIPAGEKDFGFISSGTWSLIGTELSEPVVTREVMEANLTNEVGVFGNITLLKNSIGLFIVNQLKNEYDFECGRKASWDEISDMCDKCDTETVIDLNDLAFFNPVNMAEAVWDYLVKTGQAEVEKSWPVLFKTFYQSLAACYAVTISDIEKATGKTFEKVYIVGGGASSRVLVELTAAFMGKPVVVAFGESTSMGNLALQIKYFEPEKELSDLRAIIAASFETREHVKEKGGSRIIDNYVRRCAGKA
ncbi:MAG: rhamnulokinase [Lachnospiraceae bacterium]|nr:rhamnulokinase [Lachnospiraceae bacterium]